MADFRSKLTLDGSDFSKTINDAGRSVDDFKKKTGDASKTIDEMGKHSKKTASELLNEMKTMEGLGRSTSNYRSQLAQMTRQIQDLQINYNQMSNEVKNSDFGREVASQIQELTKKAAEYKDQLQDAAAGVKLLASDTVNLDAAKSALEGVGAAMQLVASAGVLGEENTEKVVKALAKLKAIESATNAVIKISNVFNKDNILMLKLRTIWTQAQTKAQLANNSATSNGAKAVKTLTAAIKSCPFAIVATAIIALIAAYTTWSEKTHQQIEMQRKLGRRLNEDSEAIKKYGDSVGSTMGKAVASFETLASKFQLLTTYKDKEKFLKDYSKEMENLGIHAKNVNDLENIFINNVDDYRAVIEMKAEYLALQGLIEEAYADYYKKAATASKQGQSYQKGDKMTKPELFFTDLHGLVEGIDYTVIDRDFYGNITAELTGAGARKMSNAMTQTFNDAAAAGAKNAVRTYLDRLGEIENDPRWKLLNGGNGGSGKPDNKKDSKVEVKPELTQNSLAYWKAQVSQLETTVNNMKYDDVFLQPMLAQLDMAKMMVEEIEKIIKNAPSYEIMPPKTGVTLNEANKAVSELSSKLKDLDPNSEEYTKIAGYLKAWSELADKLQEQFDAITGKVNNTQKETEKTVLTMHDYLSQTNTILGSFSSMNSGISGIYSTWKNFADDMENKDPFEQMTYSIDAIISSMQTIVSIMDTINGLSQAFNSLQEIGLAIQGAKTSAISAQLGPQAAGVALAEDEAVANTIAGVGSVAESAGKIPYVGWAIALAAVAGLIALIASSKSTAHFAKGGIVPGSSFSGDHISAQLNSGEMVLNTGQQTRLFELLNGDGSLNGSTNKVEFVIKGQELKGVLNNYDKKMSRI